MTFNRSGLDLSTCHNDILTDATRISLTLMVLIGVLNRFHIIFNFLKGSRVIEAE